MLNPFISLSGGLLYLVAVFVFGPYTAPVVTWPGPGRKQKRSRGKVRGW